MIKRFAALLALASLFAGCSSNNGSMPAEEDRGPPAPSMVYTMTNGTAGNSVLAYMRAADGTLVNTATVPTGGTGVGQSLGNQGALTLSGDGRFLYVVNPASNDLSVFRVTDTTLQLTDRVPTAGTLPISVAEWNGVVYVLNRNGSSGAGSGSTIQGFQVSASGMLSPIASSAIQLQPTDRDAIQIAISPDGLWIVVTQRRANVIDVIPLNQNRTPGTPFSAPSIGNGPFGFAFSNEARLYVSEAGSATTSAYDIGSGGTLRVLSRAVPTRQGATCWLVITPDSDLVYVTNTASNSVSSYRIEQDGTLRLLVSVAATTSGGPLDAVVSEDGNYLSVLTLSSTVETFRIDPISGSLVSVQTVSGLPAGTNGLAGR